MCHSRFGNTRMGQLKHGHGNMQAASSTVIRPLESESNLGAGDFRASVSFA